MEGKKHKYLLKNFFRLMRFDSLVVAWYNDFYVNYHLLLIGKL